MQNFEKIWLPVFEKFGFEYFGGGGEFRVHPLPGALCPKCQLRFIASGAWEKRLGMGAIAPHLGEI